MPRDLTLSKRPFVWSSKWFLCILLLKILASFYLASSFTTKLFVPFLNWYVLSGFQNPWEFFYQRQLPHMFPYPPGMLWVMAIPRILFAPLLPGAWQSVMPLHLFVTRIPLLAFDLLLFALLLRFYPTQPKKVLITYWCSPIIFFINYVHGQLDIIPTAILFSALYFLIRSKYMLATFLLALSAATKTHVFIALPFVAIFLYKRRIGLKRLLLNGIFFSAIYCVLLLPYVGSEGFRQMVFNNPEQRHFFDFIISISSSLPIIVCPAVATLLFLKFVSYKKLNQEILLMFLGIVFAALVLLVPPAPGRFMWSLPFLIYFYIGNKDYSRAPFVLFNAIYVIYFSLFYKHELFYRPETYGSHPLLSAIPIDGLALSILMSSMGFIVFWMYSLGVKRNKELRQLEAPLLIGIAGDSGSGKHTLLRVLRTLVGKSRSIPVFGDDFHKWERGDEHWQIYTHLNPSATRLHQSLEFAVALRNGRPIEFGAYDHATGRFTNRRTIEPNKFIFFVGLHPYYLSQMRSLFSIKIFLDTDRTLQQYWKIQRDTLKRGYRRVDVLDQIAVREPDRARFVEPQKQFADLIIRYFPAVSLDFNRPSNTKIPLITTYTLDNSVNLETFISCLKEAPSLSVEHLSNVHTQELTVRGSIAARQVVEIAYQLGLNLDELSINTRGWLRDQNGVTQLVFLLLYNRRMKA